jgi:hypothetical protein
LKNLALWAKALFGTLVKGYLPAGKGRFAATCLPAEAGLFCSYLTKKDFRCYPLRLSSKSFFSFY